MINGNTRLLAHVGYPTSSFKAPMIYNPWFRRAGVNACVMPMGVKTDDFALALSALRKMTNFHGALITMPHKVAVLDLLDEISTTGKIAGACNAVILREDGTLAGDMFDGEGFVRGMQRKGRSAKGASALVVGGGGVGSAIAASLAQAGVARLGLFDVNDASAEKLGARLKAHYPALELELGSRDPAGWDIVVNATPLGMKDGDPLPMDVSRLAASTFVGEVVMKNELTPFLEAARGKGCAFQVGTDMLFEMIPAYLEFFGFPSTTAEELRDVAEIEYV